MKPSARLSPLRRPHPCSTNDIFKQCLFFVGVVVVAVKQAQRPSRIPFCKYIDSCISLDIIRKLTSEWDRLAAGIFWFSYHSHCIVANYQPFKASTYVIVDIFSVHLQRGAA